MLQRCRAGGGANNRDAGPQFAYASRQRRSIHSAWEIDIGQQDVDRRAPNVRKSIRGIGHAIDRKTLLGERLRDPFTDKEFVLDEQDANPLSVRRIYACVYAHQQPPPTS